VSDETGPVRFMQQLVTLDYVQKQSPIVRRFGDALVDGTIVGHRCPSCTKVYVPPRGYCPMCAEPTGDADEVTVAATGVLTGFTIIDPIQYHGQKERQPYVQATILCDGADTVIGGQRVPDVPHDQIHAGMRVEAVWNPPDRRTTEGLTDNGWGGVGNCISHWRPTGEPDVDPAKLEGHTF
jgi:uncharacterized OB-fold protein